jgi:hypothetical protein
MIIGHGIQVMGTDLIENLSSVPNFHDEEFYGDR